MSERNYRPTGAEADLLSDKPTKFEEIAFFVIYPLYDQTRHRERKWTILSWIIETIQLLSLAMYGINFNGVSAVNLVFGILEGSYYMSLFQLGFLVFSVIILAYIFLYISMLFIVAASYKKILATAPWIRRVYRNIVSVTQSILVIPFFSTLLSSLDCVDGYMRASTTTECWGTEHIVLTVFNMIMFLAFAIWSSIYGFFILRLNQKHGGLNSTFNFYFNGAYSVFLTMQAVVMRVTPTDRGWRSILTIAPTLAMIIAIFYCIPYHRLPRNMWLLVQLNFYWIVRLTCELSYFMNGNPTNYIILWVVMLCFALVTSIVLCIVLRHRQHKLLLITPDGHPLVDISSDDAEKQLPKFRSTLLVELGLRFLQEKKNRDPENVQYADLIYRIALHTHPSHAQMMMQYGLFTQLFRKHQLKGDTILRRARAMTNNVFVKFVIYSHFKNAVEEANEASAKGDDLLDDNGKTGTMSMTMSMGTFGSGMDLMSTGSAGGSAGGSGGLASVSARQMLETAQKHHEEAKMWTKEFWNNLLRPKVNYEAIPEILRRIIENEKKARDNYEELLASHPTSTAVLRGYASLLREIYRDDDAAEVYQQRADQIDEDNGDTFSMTASRTNLGDGASGTSDRSSIQRRRKQKQRKKKKAQHRMQLLEQVQADEGGTHRRGELSLPAYYPVQILIFFLFIADVIAGYFIVKYNLEYAHIHAESMHTMANVISKVGEIALSSKMLMVRVHPLYASDQSLLPTWFPTEEKLKDNLEQQSQAILGKLVAIFDGEYFDPWELQDVNLVQASYSGDTLLVDDEYIINRGLYDAVRSFAYNAHDVARVDTLLEKSYFSKLSNVIINFPSVVIESVKRANLQFNARVNRSLSFVRVCIYVTYIAFWFELSAASVLIIMIALIIMNRQRKRAFHQLLVIPKSYIHQISIALLSSDQEDAARAASISESAGGISHHGLASETGGAEQNLDANGPNSFVSRHQSVRSMDGMADATEGGGGGSGGGISNTAQNNADDNHLDLRFDDDTHAQSQEVIFPLATSGKVSPSEVMTGGRYSQGVVAAPVIYPPVSYDRSGVPSTSISPSASVHSMSMQPFRTDMPNFSLDAADQMAQPSQTAEEQQLGAKFEPNEENPPLIGQTDHLTSYLSQHQKAASLSPSSAGEGLSTESETDTAGNQSPHSFEPNEEMQRRPSSAKKEETIHSAESESRLMFEEEEKEKIDDEVSSLEDEGKSLNRLDSKDEEQKMESAGAKTESDAAEEDSEELTMVKPLNVEDMASPNASRSELQANEKPQNSSSPRNMFDREEFTEMPNDEIDKKQDSDVFEQPTQQKEKASSEANEKDTEAEADKHSKEATSDSSATQQTSMQPIPIITHSSSAKETETTTQRSSYAASLSTSKSSGTLEVSQSVQTDSPKFEYFYTADGKKKKKKKKKKKNANAVPKNLTLIDEMDANKVNVPKSPSSPPAPLQSDVADGVPQELSRNSTNSSSKQSHTQNMTPTQESANATLTHTLSASDENAPLHGQLPPSNETSYSSQKSEFNTSVPPHISSTPAHSSSAPSPSNTTTPMQMQGQPIYLTFPTNFSPQMQMGMPMPMGMGMNMNMGMNMGMSSGPYSPSSYPMQMMVGPPFNQMPPQGERYEQVDSPGPSPNARQVGAEGDDARRDSIASVREMDGMNPTNSASGVNAASPMNGAPIMVPAYDPSMWPMQSNGQQSPQPMMMMQPMPYYASQKYYMHMQSGTPSNTHQTGPVFTMLPPPTNGSLINGEKQNSQSELVSAMADEKRTSEEELKRMQKSDHHEGKKEGSSKETEKKKGNIRQKDDYRNSDDFDRQWNDEEGVAQAKKRQSGEGKRNDGKAKTKGGRGREASRDKRETGPDEDEYSEYDVDGDDDWESPNRSSKPRKLNDRSRKEIEMQRTHQKRKPKRSAAESNSTDFEESDDQFADNDDNRHRNAPRSPKQKGGNRSVKNPPRNSPNRSKQGKSKSKGKQKNQRNSEPEVPTSVQVAAPVNPAAATAYTFAEEEEKEDGKMNGAVMNKVQDDEWIDMLTKAVQKSIASYKSLPSVITASHIIRMALMIAIFLVVGIVFSVILLVFVVNVGTVSSSVMLSGYREIQFYQTILLLQSTVFHKGEITLTKQPEMPDGWCTSDVYCGFDHLSTSVPLLSEVLGKSYDTLTSVTNAVISGTGKKTGWTTDSKLDVATVECSPEVTSIIFKGADGEDNCPLENKDDCVDGRISGYDMFFSFGLMSARFDRKMVQVGLNLSGALTPQNRNYGFITTAAMYDLAAQYDLYTRGFFHSLEESFTKVTTTTIACLAVELVFLVCAFAVFIIPFKRLMSSMALETMHLKQLIPSSLTEHIELSTEMKTGVAQIDTPRKKLLEVIAQMYDSVVSYSPKTELRSLSNELLLQTKQVFLSEEKMMVESNYPEEDRKEHAKEHLRLRQRLTILCSILRNREDSIAFGAVNIFGTVLHEHFSSMDKVFAAHYAKEKNIILEDIDSDDDDDDDDMDEAAVM
ncbi:uncharacterized protein MONOS_148 [Monocercomonoides exilis]|uniref:uncharacterized protein n=1 Tax=Monocercomonoides exilis TaxID=2049356 RepID=UPI003559DBB6|nr:hypothetical protein MONOS_148 [Monocercomonoides exilis]|eukprot:MONOS_148.1-p1 / transcript=MONOS_148.1 / gene=MONOS_148 / organism=Monocercomonoides_exilis_PA203 / gene_product=unspecified product / transcript_product=unspecified product / location=Mono_scaffold00003:18171-26168(-) / protein_length=2502 / sequence_SO=supercontig / SO=protein_coding / is_pseudo=false